MGEKGDDTLYGQSGKDILRGGSGSDSMWGGSEADVFDFDLVSHSPASARDLIWDFSKAEGDKLDLSGIDANNTNFWIINDAFTFIGSNDFTGVPGQLRFEQHDAFFDNTTVSGDVDGDGAADFEAVCLGLIDFTAADFML